MRVKVDKSRKVFKGNSDSGRINENKYEVLEFTFQDELDGLVKYIEIEAENEEGKLRYVDRIENNEFVVTNWLSKYPSITAQIICKDLNQNKVFKSAFFDLNFEESFNILEDFEEENHDLLDRIEAELQEVYQGMEEFKTEIVEDANSRFNTNVREKTQGFNTNAETKTNTFNSNYDEKLGTFNTNATNKLEQYNNNDTAKTQTYNTNATEKLNTYNTNATNKLAEYNENAETKLNAYNTNATQKLAEYDSRVADLHEDLDETQAKVEQYNTNIDTKYTQYNTNAEQKLSAYNQNATTKTNSYNTNAQTKLDTFNTNATNKTNTYNTNATEKLTAYNTNATEKIDEYNENASELMTSVETLEQKHDNEVAELNEKIADLQEQVEMAGDLIPTGEATGDNITLNDSAWYRFKKIVPRGKSEQETFTGKNKLNVSSQYTITQADDLKRKLHIEPNVTYKITFDNLEKGGNNNPSIIINETVVIPVTNNRTFSITEEMTSANIYSNGSSYAGSEGITSTITNFMISEEGGNYEPYTGGQPAPNPDYEYPIQNVTGDVEVKVENKNLYTGNIVNLGIGSSLISPTGYSLSYNNNIRSTYIKCLPNQIISISRKDLSNNRFRIGFTEIEPANAVSIFNYMNRDSFLKVEGIIVPENANYLFIYLSNDETLPIDLMIEEGLTATDYIAHEEQTVTFPLEEGQVFHESDTIEDKIVQRRKTVAVTITSISTNSRGYQTAVINLPNKVKTYSSLILCSRASRKQINPVDGQFAENTNNIVLVGSQTDTLETMKEKYDGVIIEYELETPIEIPFTEAQRTAKAQIDKLYSYKGTTHITSNANLDVTYRKDTNSKLEELEARIALLEE